MQRTLMHTCGWRGSAGVVSTRTARAPEQLYMPCTSNSYLKHGADKRRPSRGSPLYAAFVETKSNGVPTVTSPSGKHSAKEASPVTPKAKQAAAKKQHMAVPQQPVPAPNGDDVAPIMDPLAVLTSSRHAKEAGLAPRNVYRNLSVPELYEMALKTEKDTRLASSGALMANSYAKKGRSPKDKRVMRDPGTEADVWWGGASPNYPMEEQEFLINRQRSIDYLNLVENVYVVDAFVNWKQSAKLKVRVVCTRPYHALFMHNMLIRPTAEELRDFGEPDFVIYNAGEFPANCRTKGMTSNASIDLSFKHNEMVILGTQYAGEMKKGVFTVLNYLMPKRGILSLHSGANVGRDGDVSLFFGLSGTGKTTLSADPRRPLIGDDEHCWDSEGVFNAEGGCYAKAINLKQEKEPEIWQAIKFGTILENVDFDPHTRVVDYDGRSQTENTRICYPIDYIQGAHIPCVAGHPKNIMLLCCDAFGVLPPVSKLTPDQAMYWFVSGYTAKVAGTEVGVTEPEATFSACFGSVFLVWHPMKYAAMLAEQMKKYGGTAWLINTGWVGGQYGTGQRINLKHTRAILDAIHSGELEAAKCTQTPVFGLQVPESCSGVPTEVLHPRSAWKDKQGFDSMLARLGGMFAKNFEKYKHDGEQYVGPDMVQRMIQGGPVVE